MAVPYYPYEKLKIMYNPMDENRGNLISPGSTAGRRLKDLGMSDAGIHQLSAGQPILNKNDQTIVTRIVVAAIG